MCVRFSLPLSLSLSLSLCVCVCARVRVRLIKSLYQILYPTTPSQRWDLIWLSLFTSPKKNLSINKTWSFLLAVYCLLLTIMIYMYINHNIIFCDCLIIIFLHADILGSGWLVDTSGSSHCLGCWQWVEGDGTTWSTHPASIRSPERHRRNCWLITRILSFSILCQYFILVFISS